MRFSDLYADARDITEKVDLVARALNLVLTEDQVAELGPAQLDGATAPVGQLLDNNVAGYKGDSDIVVDQVPGIDPHDRQPPVPEVERDENGDPVEPGAHPSNAS